METYDFLMDSDEQEVFNGIIEAVNKEANRNCNDITIADLFKM